jgi:tRNA (cytidine/uridine-2'-O-)-methyltransferase
LGFELSDKKLKRAGLDYWDWVAVTIHQDIDAFIEFFNELEGEKALIAYSKFGTKSYAEDGLYKKNARSFLMFGAETTGLPEVAHDVACKHGHIVKIPMKNSQHVRSLNLATSVGIGVFEALRQLDGPS